MGRLFPQWMAVQQEVGVSTLECGMTMALAGHLVGNCLKEQSQTNRVRHSPLLESCRPRYANYQRYRYTGH